MNPNDTPIWPGNYVSLALLTATVLIAMTMLSQPAPTNNQTPVLISEQLLLPSKIWDWTPAQTGVLPLNMINFVDTLPASCARSGSFNFSSNRLFDNYSLLLDLVDGSFQPQSALISAKQLLQRPNFAPTSDNYAPLGWAKMQDGSNIIRWTPSYSVSSWSDQWLAQVKTQGNNRQTLRLPLGNNTPSPLQLTDNNDAKLNVALPKAMNYLEVSAQAWNRIKVTPGSWFNAGLVQLLKAHQGSFSGGYSHDDLFGAKGLLNCRVSELLVAYKPEVELIGDAQFVQQYETPLMQAKKVNVGALNFTNANKQPLNNQQVLYTLSTDSEQAFIIAVNVTAI